ncbi:FHA domain-containing protein [Oceanicoccus sagamiensis]|uniref:FHA domain-containing protein n=1 Tax=Oceanicoccus sagamiensis TaxID=716816 RepID=A0A1X9NB30_9GAMM|nr:FHA domain-containing protein [Oceanicoccus sagamiensis]ARN73125.1 hypothetical protein BST96_02790 [Oceanicoccus sagamiensis]
MAKNDFWRLVDTDSSTADIPLQPGKALTVGRDPDCDIVLNSDCISRKHATLELITGGVHVIDLGSSNGSFVNDIPVGSGSLAKADDDIGFDTLRYQLKAPTPSVAATRVTPIQQGETTVLATAAAFLEGRSHAIANEIFPLAGQSFSIGRDENCDLPVQHSSVSFQHALLSCHNGLWTISDQQSSNGTLVNGKPAMDTPLKHGNKISCGNVILEYKVIGATAEMQSVQTIAPPQQPNPSAATPC